MNQKINKIYEDFRTQNFKIVKFIENDILPLKIDIQEQLFIYINFAYSVQNNITSTCQFINFVLEPETRITFKDLDEFIDAQAYIKYNFNPFFIDIIDSEEKTKIRDSDEEIIELDNSIIEEKIEKIDYSKMKIKELKKLCKEKDFDTKLKCLKKQEYINCLENNTPLRQKKPKLSKEERQFIRDMKKYQQIQEKYGMERIQKYFN